MSKRFYLCEKQNRDNQAQKQKRWAKVEIEEAFPFLKEEHKMISLVGAGGKSTLMEHMAEACGKNGRKVLLTTSTHIWKPERWPWYGVAHAVEVALVDHAVVVLGKQCTCGKGTSSQKLEYPGREEILSCMEMADVILVEADGSKSRPCKVPGLHEPVILGESNVIVAVTGMEGLGKPIKDVCFRIPQILQLLKITDENHCLTVEDYITILCSEKGACKGVEQRAFYIFLNQCDTEELIEQAKNIAEGVRKRLQENLKDIVISGRET